MTEFKKHTDKIAISVLRGEYADYDKNWWHYDREYNMLLKAQTEAFKLANEASEQQDKEAIDTVLSELEKPLPTDEQIEAYALENILDGDSVESFVRLGYWESGARWMRDLRGEATK